MWNVLTNFLFEVTILPSFRIRWFDDLVIGFWMPAPGFGLSWLDDFPTLLWFKGFGSTGLFEFFLLIGNLFIFVLTGGLLWRDLRAGGIGPEIQAWLRLDDWLVKNSYWQSVILAFFAPKRRSFGSNLRGRRVYWETENNHKKSSDHPGS